MPEGKEKEQLEIYLKKIMKENYPNLVKEIDLQEVQEAQRVLNKLDPKRNTARHILIKVPKVKDREILKAAREKQTVTYEGVTIRLR